MKMPLLKGLMEYRKINWVYAINLKVFYKQRNLPNKVRKYTTN